MKKKKKDNLKFCIRYHCKEYPKNRECEEEEKKRKWYIMNLDKYIKIQLIILSEKYDISVVDITKVTDGQVSKKYTVNYKEKKENAINKQEHFNNKRKLVSWLLCLN